MGIFWLRGGGCYDNSIEIAMRYPYGKHGCVVGEQLERRLGGGRRTGSDFTWGKDGDNSAVHLHFLLEHIQGVPQKWRQCKHNNLSVCL